VGCPAEVTRGSIGEHMDSTTTLHAHMALLLRAVTRATEDNAVLRQEIDLMRRDTHSFVWVIPHFDTRRGPMYSRKFNARGHLWYVGVDFEGPDHYAGVYLFAEGHNKRVEFRLVLLNAVGARDRVHTVSDWAIDYKGKGWGPLKFIDRSTIAQNGFLVQGSVRIMVELLGEPYD
jgi:hypothetical protein